MARNLIPSDKSIKGIKADDKRKRLNDGDGLFLLLFVKGGAHGWRFAYSLNGRRNNISLGTYPDIGLAAARTKADEARKLVAVGVDPSAVRTAAKVEGQGVCTFETVARDWLTKVHEPSVSARYHKRSLIQLERDAFPWIGSMKAADVSVPIVLGLLRRVQSRGALDTAHRVKQTIGLVMRYAIQNGIAERDPTPDLKGALPKAVKQHYAALVDTPRVAELLRAIEGYSGQPGTRAALKLAPMLFQRPGNLRAMQWAHLDLDAATWSIPAAEMKRNRQDKATGAPHVVPLARQAVDTLRGLKLHTGMGKYCFPGLRSRSRPISDVTINAALRRLGFGQDEMTAHGFRAMARTVIAEELPDIDPEWVETQLAHGKKGPLGGAYDRSRYVAQRRHMMQVWADYLDRLREGANQSKDAHVPPMAEVGQRGLVERAY